MDSYPRYGSADFDKYGISPVVILSAIQSAYQDLGISPERSVEVKRKLLELAAKDEVDLLVYHAIVDIVRSLPPNSQP